MEQFAFDPHEHLWWAAFRGRAGQVRRLVERWGADPNWPHPRMARQTALHAACQQGHLPVLEYLLRVPGTDPTSLDLLGGRALASCLARQRWAAEATRLLLRHPNIDRATFTSGLVAACTARHCGVMRLYLEDPRIQWLPGNEHAASLLEMAVISGSRGGVELLLAGTPVRPASLEEARQAATRWDHPGLHFLLGLYARHPQQVRHRLRLGHLLSSAPARLAALVRLVQHRLLAVDPLPCQTGGFAAAARW